MVSLTLRSGRDGRFLARVVDRGGFAFVLDFGDQRVIDDVSQRLLKGFTMWRMGTLVTAVPQQSEMLQLLAEFYAHEGLLVSYEEPNWPRESRRLALDASSADDLEDDPATELVPIPIGDIGLLEEDEPTELAPIPLAQLADSGEDEPTEVLDTRGVGAESDSDENP